MEVSLVAILMLDSDVSRQVHDWLQTNRANLLDSLVNGLDVRLEGLAGGELSPALTAPVTHLFPMLALSVLLLFLPRVKAFFTSLALKPGWKVRLLVRIVEENVDTASLHQTGGVLSIEIYNTFYVLQIC